MLLSSAAFAQIPPTGIQDEGGNVSRPVFIVDCSGDGIECTHSGITATISVAGTSSTSGSCWEEDVNLALMPVSGDCTDDPLWELSGGALQPI